MLYIPSERANLLWFSSNTDKRVRKRSLDDELWYSYQELRHIVWSRQPMTDRVIYIMQQSVFSRFSEKELERRLGDSNMLACPDCTLKTALNRLMKNGTIGKQIIEHGCYRHYVYFVKGT